MGEVVLKGTGSECQVRGKNIEELQQQILRVDRKNAKLKGNDTEPKPNAQGMVRLKEELGPFFPLQIVQSSNENTRKGLTYAQGGRSIMTQPRLRREVPSLLEGQPL